MASTRSRVTGAGASSPTAGPHIPSDVRSFIQAQERIRAETLDQLSELAEEWETLANLQERMRARTRLLVHTAMELGIPAKQIARALRRDRSRVHQLLAAG